MKLIEIYINWLEKILEVIGGERETIPLLKKKLYLYI
jgi:hypothetical protein